MTKSIKDLEQEILGIELQILIRNEKMWDLKQDILDLEEAIQSIREEIIVTANKNSERAKNYGN